MLRIQDLQLYLPQLQHYKQTSTSLIDWIDATRKKQDALQATKIDNVPALNNHISNQKVSWWCLYLKQGQCELSGLTALYCCCFKALNTEIKGRRDTVESVLRDNEACVTSVKVRTPACPRVFVFSSFIHFVSLQDYETDLATYTSGLETLLNIPIKRTMLRSPSVDLNQEVAALQLGCCDPPVFRLVNIFTSCLCFCARPHKYRPAIWNCSLFLVTTTSSWESYWKTWRSSRYLFCFHNVYHVDVNKVEFPQSGQKSHAGLKKSWIMKG